MASDDDSQVSRLRSRHGTEIAYWTSGHGPPLVVVHGTPADHTRWGPLLPYLEPHFTVHAVDRRGRGGSSDSPDYALEGQEHVADVLDPEGFAARVVPFLVGTDSLDHGRTIGASAAWRARRSSSQPPLQ